MRVTSVSSPERCTTAGVTNVPSSRSRGGTVAENVTRRSNRVPSGFRRKAWNTPSLFFVPEDPPSPMDALTLPDSARPSGSAP